MDYIEDSIRRSYLELNLISKILVSMKIITRMLSISFLPENSQIEEFLWSSGTADKILKLLQEIFFIEGYYL